MRYGFSLLEVIVAGAIFALVATMAVEATVRSIELSSMGSAKDDLVNEGRKAMQAIADDISLAGWYLPIDQSPPVSQYPMTAVSDRAAIYYPYVVSPRAVPSQFLHLRRPSSLVVFRDLPRSAPVGLGGAIDFPIPEAGTGDFTRNWTEGFTDVPESDGTAYHRSFWAPSQEIVFIRSQQSNVTGELGFLSFPKNDPDAWRLRPTELTATGVQAQRALGILSMSEWRRAVDDPATPSGQSYRIKTYRHGGVNVDRPVHDIVLPSSWLDLRDLRAVMRWETLVPLVTDPEQPDFNMTGGSGSEPGIAQAQLREFMFAVLPGSPSSGLGRLVRAHKVASPPSVTTRSPPELGDCISAGETHGMVVDKILSDHVVRLVVDTYRTLNQADPQGLEVNQVRIRIYMVREYGVGKSNVVAQMLEQTVIMRGRSGVAEEQEDRQLLTGSTSASTFFFPR